MNLSNRKVIRRNARWLLCITAWTKLGDALIDFERSGYFGYLLNWIGGDGELYEFQ